MTIINRFQFNFIANWRFGVIALLVVLFFMRLGYWQIDRANEKKHLLATQQNLAQQSPISWFSGNSLPSQYQPIIVQGRYSPATLLLDNQHYQHQFGYDVLSPLILEDGRVILIDRGFVRAAQDRMTIPEVNTPYEKHTITGTVYYPSDKQWSLGNIFDRKQAGLTIIELIDIRILAQFLHKSLYPFIIRLHPDASNGFVRDWPVVAMAPSRHLGYAVQWFAMALAVIILFIVLNIKKKL